MVMTASGKSEFTCVYVCVCMCVCCESIHDVQTSRKWIQAGEWGRHLNALIQIHNFNERNNCHTVVYRVRVCPVCMYLMFVCVCV